jgi:hypothetical protein
MAEMREHEAPSFENIEKTYIESVMPFMSKFIKVKLNVVDIERINEVVRNHLNVKDNFKVNDRFEGKAYQLKVTKSLMAIIAIEKNYKLKLIDWGKLINSKNYNIRDITIENKLFTVVPFVFGAMPMLEKTNNTLILVLVQPQERACYICGIANLDVDELNQELHSHNQISKTQIKFSSFGDLKHLVLPLS